ncbi:MAG: hypothetical protein ACRC62_09220 [Microcoleus sp.]
MIAPETTFLIQKLRSAAPGETVFYAELNEAVGGVDVRVYYRARLSSAIKIVRRDYGLIFVAIPDVGYQLLKAEDVSVMAESKGLADVKRSTDRWDARLKTVDYDQLETEKSRANYDRSCTRLAFVEMAASEEGYALAARKLKPMNKFKQSKADIIAAIEYGVS